MISRLILAALLACGIAASADAQTVPPSGFNTRIGAVTLAASDLYHVGGLMGTEAACSSTSACTVAANIGYEALIGTFGTGGVTATLPAASAEPFNGFMVVIKDEAGTASAANPLTIARAGSDTIDGTTSTSCGVAYCSITVMVNSAANGWAIVTSLSIAAKTCTNQVITVVGSAGVICTTLTSAYLPAATAYLNVKQKYTAPQAGTPVNVAISTATFTPNFDTTQNLEIDLTSACPCTLANPSGTLVAGTSGMVEIHQDATGSRTIGTWGSDYEYVGGTSTITLSTAANAIDYLFYYVNNAATSIILGTPLKAPTH